MAPEKTVAELTVAEFTEIVRDVVAELLEQKLQAHSCPVCEDAGYLDDPVTGVEIACFCRTSSGVLCVKNPPHLFA